MNFLIILNQNSGSSTSKLVWKTWRKSPFSSNEEAKPHGNTVFNFGSRNLKTWSWKCTLAIHFTVYRFSPILHSPGYHFLLSDAFVLFQNKGFSLPKADRRADYSFHWTAILKGCKYLDGGVNKSQTGNCQENPYRLDLSNTHYTLVFWRTQPEPVVMDRTRILEIY